MESRRGAEGGYLLAKGPESIRVGDVIRFIEGPRDERTRARRNAVSPFADMWQRVDRAVSEVLDQTSFADLERQWKEKRTKFVPNWEI